MRIHPVFSSLRTRQLLLVSVVLIPAMVLMALKAASDHNKAMDEVRHETQFLASQIGMFSKEVLPEPQLYLAHLATIPEVTQGGGKCKTVLKDALRTNYFFHNIFVLDHAGNMTCSGLNLSVPLQLGDRSYFQRAMTSKSFAIGDYQLSRPHNVPVVVFAFPVRDSSNQIAAVIGASVKLAWFQEAFKRALASTGTHGVAAEAVDTTGVVIASAPDPRTAGVRLPEWARLQPRLQSKVMHVQSETWKDGVARTTAYLPLYHSNTADMYLRVGVPLDAPMAEVWKESQSNLGVMVVFAVMTLTMTWWLSNWLLLRPVKSLTRTAQLLGSGVLDARSQVAGTSGELGELARRFNAMAEQLEQQHTALTRVNRAQTILGATGSAMLRAKEERSLLQDVCSIIQELGGFHIAWVGYRDTTNDAGVVTKAYVGSDTMPNLKRSEVYAADREGGPVLSAIRSGKVQLFHNLDKQSGASGWQKRMADLGMRSAIGLPIKAGEEVLGGLAIFSADQDASWMAKLICSPRQRVISDSAFMRFVPPGNCGRVKRC